MSGLPPVPALAFSEEGHRYTVAGRQVDHVTAPLDFFNTEVQRVSIEILEAAGALGTAVHLACAIDDRHRFLGGPPLDDNSVDDLVLPYLLGWRRFCDDCGFRPDLVEQPFYHPEIDCAGTVDVVGKMKGARWLLDRKSGVLSRFTGPQTGGYKLLAERNGAGPIEARGAVHLGPAWPLGYKLVQCRDLNDPAYFTAMLTTYRFLKGAK